MLNKFDVQFEGTLDEFNAWIASVFKDPGKVQVKVEVRLANSQVEDPLVRAVSETFRREIAVEVADEIRRLVRGGERIAAIKALRTATGLELAPARDFIAIQFPDK